MGADHFLYLLVYYFRLAMLRMQMHIEIGRTKAAWSFLATKISKEVEAKELEKVQKSNWVAILTIKRC